LPKVKHVWTADMSFLVQDFTKLLRINSMLVATIIIDLENAFVTQYSNNVSILSISVTYLTNTGWEFEKTFKSDSINPFVSRVYFYVLYVTVMF
jgi:hypothetical protein